MNEQQAYLSIRNAVRLEDLGIKTAAKVTPELNRIFSWLGKQIQAIEGSGSSREIEYRAMRQQIASIFRPVNADFYLELRRAIDDEAYRQVAFAQAYLNVAEAGESKKGVNPVPSTGISTGGETGKAYKQVTRTQIEALARDTKVLGQNLETIFGIDSEESAWINTNIKLVDRTVKQGFLLGQTNEEISRELALAGKISRRQAHAISRTAVMDVSANAQEAFWDANKDVVAGWEFDASMDSRVCPLCAPWDGRSAVKRGELPSTPVHVNCRCRALPLTETELLLRKEQGPQRRTVIELVEAKSKEEALAIARAGKNVTGARAYASQVKVNGKKYWRVAKDITQPGHPLTMGEFLAQATPQTKAAVLGSKKQADRFSKLVSDRGKSTTPMSPDEALRRVTDFKGEGKTNSALEGPKVRKIRRVRRPDGDGPPSPPPTPPPGPGPKPTPPPAPPAAPPPPPAPKPTPAPKPAPAPVAPAITAPSAPKPERGSLADDLEYAGAHNLMPAKQKLRPDDIQQSFAVLAEMKGEAGDNFKQMLEFQRKADVTIAWSTGTESKAADYAHWNDPKMIRSLRSGPSGHSGTNISLEVAGDLERTGQSMFLPKIGKVSKDAAGHTVDGGAFVVMKTQKEHVRITESLVSRIRQGSRDSVEAAKIGKPRQITGIDAYYRRPGTTSVITTDEGWVNTYVHEMGHQIHFKANLTKITDYIDEAYVPGNGPETIESLRRIKAATWKPSVYGTTNEKERFAETYTQYVFAPTELRSANPAAYRWVEDTIKKAMQ